MEARFWCVGLVVVAGLTGCVTKPAPEFSGRWRPVNVMPKTPQALPINPAYVFYATPIDGTLRGLLKRWANDARMRLEYRVDSDFTLYEPVARIRAGNAHEAIAQIDAAYRAQGITVAVEQGVITVTPVASNTSKAN